MNFSIQGQAIGSSQPVFIIAELSGNHCGRLERALELVAAAKEAGANAVKLQTYTADTITIRCDGEHFRVGAGTLWAGRQLHDLYAEASTPWEWHPRLFAEANALGLGCFSSPFDPTAVEYLESLQCPAYKIASFEIVDLPLIRRVAETGKPLILSTGMASLEEITEALGTARSAGAGPIALLKCTSGYPARPDEMNLRTISDLAARFSVSVGLSDHTLGNVAATVAVALGAQIIEKHLTLRRSDGGPDAAFSLEPSEFGNMVEAIRVAEATLGQISYTSSENELASKVFRRSLHTVKAIRKGERLTGENVRSIRPSGGLAPKYLSDVLGAIAARDLPLGTPLQWGDIAQSH